MKSLRRQIVVGQLTRWQSLKACVTDKDFWMVVMVGVGMLIFFNLLYFAIDRTLENDSARAPQLISIDHYDR